MDIFFKIHQDLPREGPGDSQSTHKAIALMLDLPAKPRILDIGCGPGTQTLDLAVIPGAKITAVDTHQPFLDQLQKRVVAHGLGKRIETVNQSMFELQFSEKSFDVLWSEGAIYIIGFENGLKIWRPLLKSGGYIGVTEISWLKPNPPEEIYSFWKNDYPDMHDVYENLKIMQAANYRVLGHFVLPTESWWDDYYTPILARLPALREEYRDDPQATAVFDASQKEMELYSKYSDYYGYVFYVGQVL